MFHQTTQFADFEDEYYGGTGTETDESHGSRGSTVHVSQAFMDGLYADDEVRAVRFDPHEELLWSISANGHLTGYYEYGLTRVLSVEVPELGESERRGKGRQSKSGLSTGRTEGSSEGVGELRAVVPGAQASDRIVMVLAERALLVYSKTGVRRALISPTISVTSGSPVERLDKMRCLCLATSAATGASSNPSNVIIGTDSRLALFDIDTCQVMRHISLSPHSGGSTSASEAAANHTVGATQLLAHSRGLLCATDDGQIVSVDWRDRRSIQQHHSFKPHSHSLSDFTANSEGYAVVSCGTFFCNQRVYTDPFLKVYDLRYRKAQCPIKVVQEMQPGFVRFVPGFNDSILLADPCGRFQIANFGENELPAPLDEALLVSEYDSIRTIDISSSSRLIAFGTRGGLISLVANTSTGPGLNSSAGNSVVGTSVVASSTGVPAGVTAAVGACDAVVGGGPTDLGNNSSLKINHCSIETVFPPVPAYMQLPPVSFNDNQFITCSAEFTVRPLDTTRFSSLSSDWPAHLCSGRYRLVNGSGVLPYDYYTTMNVDKHLVKENERNNSANFRSILLDEWSNIRPRYMNVTMRDVDDRMIAWLFFIVNNNDDITSWFSKHNLRDSHPWNVTVLLSKNYNYFSIIGDRQYTRSFSINIQNGGCDGDLGLMVVHDIRDVCQYNVNWLNNAPYPQILMSASATNFINYYISVTFAKSLEIIGFFDSQVNIYTFI